MWRFFGSRIALKRSTKLFCVARSDSTRLFSIRNVKNGGILRYTLGFGGFTLAGGVSYFAGSTSVLRKTLEEANCEDEFATERQTKQDGITLYQYASCPFCNKVRAFLDYYGMEYSIVEVDPLFKKELKFSEYKKVPIVLIEGIQLHDSSMIISLLRSYLLKQDSLKQLIKYYPPITSRDSNGKEVTEHTNRYGIMYKVEFDETKHEEIKNERRWRKWVDDTFIHTLSPNIYRTWQEAMEASNYFSDIGQFSATQRFLAKYVGAIVMYYIGRKMKKKYRLKDDVRESMYDEARMFTKAVGKREFMGGKQPNLADLAMFGVLRGIEGLSAVDDLKQHTNIAPWFDRMKSAVENHEGAAVLKSSE